SSPPPAPTSPVSPAGPGGDQAAVQLASRLVIVPPAVRSDQVAAPPSRAAATPSIASSILRPNTEGDEIAPPPGPVGAVVAPPGAALVGGPVVIDGRAADARAGSWTIGTNLAPLAPAAAAPVPSEASQAGSASQPAPIEGGEDRLSGVDLRSPREENP